VELRRRGEPLEDADILIAATALTHDLILVTDNEQHFQRIAELKVENWRRGPEP
jgi:tRNA(fMet)-specific endonuclease VapC